MVEVHLWPEMKASVLMTSSISPWRQFLPSTAEIEAIFPAPKACTCGSIRSRTSRAEPAWRRGMVGWDMRNGISLKIWGDRMEYPQSTEAREVRKKKGFQGRKIKSSQNCGRRLSPLAHALGLGYSWHWMSPMTCFETRDCISCMGLLCLILLFII